jgi:hypothetical protein
MGFLSNLVSGVVKVALTPIAVAKDAYDIATGEDANNTKDLIESAGEDFEDMIEGE